jgi:hypothetical protein
MQKYVLEERVFSFLLEKRKTTTLEVVNVFGDGGYSKQGVYKVLHKLKNEGKILWSKTQIEIHLLWLHRQIQLLATALPQKEIVFQEFAEKRRVYYAQNLIELENVYGQIFISLISSLGDSVKNYLFYDLHNYTYINTTQVVDWYIDFILKHGGRVYLLVGSKSALDLAIKKKNKMQEIHIHCIDKKWNTNVSVIGEYVIRVTTNKKIAKHIDQIFDNKSEVEAKELITNLYEEKAIHKIVVEKNPKLAHSIENTFKKYFLLK